MPLFSQGSSFHMISMVLACLLLLYWVTSSGWQREQSLGVTTVAMGTLYFCLAVGQVAAAVVFFVLLGHVLIPRLGQVAVQAGDVGVGVAAVGPVPEQTGVGLLVAFDAGLGLRRNAAFDAEFLDLGKVGLSHG
jgi:hypothetical protein